MIDLNQVISGPIMLIKVKKCNYIDESIETIKFRLWG